MDEELYSAWQLFEKTGSIDAYLAFKARTKNEFNIEAGEDFGFNKDVGDCDTGNEIR